MLPALATTFLALGFFFLCQAVFPGQGNWRIYYDKDWNPVPFLDKVEEGSHLKTTSLRFGSLPCSCEEWTCGCCTNINLSFIKRFGCLKFTYDPNEFSLEMNVLMNNESVYENSISAKNPPPACLDVPVPYIPSVTFCMKLYDIYTPGRNIHFCLDFETRLVQAPVLVLQFDCMQMGSEGITHLKPSNSPLLLAPKNESLSE